MALNATELRTVLSSEGISPAELLQRFALFAVWVLLHGYLGNVTNDQVDYGKTTNYQEHQTQPVMPDNCNHEVNGSRAIRRFLNLR